MINGMNFYVSEADYKQALRDALIAFMGCNDRKPEGRCLEKNSAGWNCRCEGQWPDLPW